MLENLNEFITIISRLSDQQMIILAICIMPFILVAVAGLLICLLLPTLLILNLYRAIKDQLTLFQIRYYDWKAKIRSRK